MFLIGEFAQLNGISAKRLRHYHEIELFTPAWIDPQTAYRHYLASQIPDLRRIMALISLGIPLATLCELRHGGADLEPELRRCRQDLEQERRRIADQLTRLDIRLERSEEHDIVERTRPSGHWAALERPLGSPLNPMFVEVERHIQRSGTRAPRPPVSVRTDSTVTVMIPVDEPIESKTDIEHRWTPATRVATTLVTGGYDGVQDAVDALVRYTRARSDQVWLTYLRFGAEPELALPEAFLTDRATELVTEVQVEI